MRLLIHLYQTGGQVMLADHWIFFKGLLGSLERLQLDYVDIMLISRDSERVCSIEEIVRACTFVVQQGWTFYWGTSNWPPNDIMVRLCFLPPLQNAYCPILDEWYNTSSTEKKTSSRGGGGD